MVSSAFYFCDTVSKAGMQRATVFVLGSHEQIQAEKLIEQAVQKGASIIIMAREYAGAYRQLFQNDVRPGVTYIFSRSIGATLSRWQAERAPVNSSFVAV
jgi:UDP-N-acetylmuramyl pentapeptide synthase